MIKNTYLLNDLEKYYLKMGVLKAYFKLRKLDYMLIAIYGEKDE